MRSILTCLVLLSTLSPALAQPANPPPTPEHLLPANCIAYFRYDGYEPHRKAYDQTGLGKAMSEGLGEFFEHVFERMCSLDDLGRIPIPAVGPKSRPAVDGFLACLSRHGFALALEVPPARDVGNAESLYQITIVFPQGAAGKNRQALEDFFRFIAGREEIKIDNVDLNGRPAKTFARGDTRAAWWVEGDHLVATYGTRPIGVARQVALGQKPNLTSAAWFRQLASFNRYETDMRGRIDLAAIVDHLAVFGLEPPGLRNIKDHVLREILLRHLGLTGLKDLSFHLGFDGKFQRSTVRLGVVEPEKRTGLLRLLAGPTDFPAGRLTPDQFPPIPPDADLVSVRHLDWEKIYDYARTSYAMLALTDLKSLLGDGAMPTFPDLDRLLGVDFRQDFLQQLDSTSLTWGGHSEGPFFLGQGFAVKVKDAVKVKKSLQAIVKVLGESDEGLKAEKQTFRGQDMYVFSGLGLPLSFTLHNDWLVFALFPQPVQGFLLRSGGKYRTWKAPAEFDTALARERQDAAGGKLLGLSVSDPRPMVQLGLSLLPVLFNYVNLAAGSKTFDVAKIPNAQTVNEWLFPNSAFLYDDGTALRWEHHYSINEPDDFLQPLFAPYAMSLLEWIPYRRRPAADPPNPGQAEAAPAIAKLKEPTLCPATATEKDGAIQISIVTIKKVAVPVSKQVEEIVIAKVVGKDGVVRDVPKKVVKTVVVMEERAESQTSVLTVDGKVVTVTSKDGKAVDPKDLPKLLAKETQVLVVPGDKVDPAELKKTAEGTLIIFVKIDELPQPPPKAGAPSPPLGGLTQPALCPASATESDGAVQIRITVTRHVPYTTTRMVSYKETRKVVDKDGVERIVEATFFKPVQETSVKKVSTTAIVTADGKSVRVSSKDGQPVDPRELLKLLAKETQVLVVPGDNVDPAELKKTADGTLILFVKMNELLSPPRPAPLPPP